MRGMRFARDVRGQLDSLMSRDLSQAHAHDSGARSSDADGAQQADSRREKKRKRDGVCTAAPELLMLAAQCS